MEVNSPTFNKPESSYTFELGGTLPTIATENAVYIDSSFTDASSLVLPVLRNEFLDVFLGEFIEKSKGWFATPLRVDVLKKRLRHESLRVVTPEKEGWYLVTLRPHRLIIKSKEFSIFWKVAEYKEASPKIQVDFSNSALSRPQSPEQAMHIERDKDKELRTIQIQNQPADSLIPIGDLPLSDLPPLSFMTDEVEDPKKEEVKRRIREARLKVALAKLKAERMEQKYYAQYGERPENSEESSSYTSEEEPDGVLGSYSYS